MDNKKLVKISTYYCNYNLGNYNVHVDTLKELKNIFKNGIGNYKDTLYVQFLNNGMAYGYYNGLWKRISKNTIKNGWAYITETNGVWKIDKELPKTSNLFIPNITLEHNINNIVFIIHYDTHRVQMSIPIDTLHNIKKSDYDIVNVIKQIFDTAEIEKADREKYVEILNLLKL